MSFLSLIKVHLSSPSASAFLGMILSVCVPSKVFAQECSPEIEQIANSSSVVFYAAEPRFVTGGEITFTRAGSGVIVRTSSDSNVSLLILTTEHVIKNSLETGIFFAIPRRGRDSIDENSEPKISLNGNSNNNAIIDTRDIAVFADSNITKTLLSDNDVIPMLLKNPSVLEVGVSVAGTPREETNSQGNLHCVTLSSPARLLRSELSSPGLEQSSVFGPFLAYEEVGRLFGGMSGGAIIDENGRLIGIHRSAEPNAAGIPISTFWDNSSFPSSLRESIRQAASTQSPSSDFPVVQNPPTPETLAKPTFEPSPIAVVPQSNSSAIGGGTEVQNPWLGISLDGIDLSQVDIYYDVSLDKKTPITDLYGQDVILWAEKIDACGNDYALFVTVEDGVQTPIPLNRYPLGRIVKNSSSQVVCPLTDLAPE